MIVLIDTEFTSLIAPEILSIGLVTLDGRELYIELDLESDAGKDRISRATAFVQFQDVIPQWGRIQNAKVSAFEMGQRVAEWLIGIASESQNPAVTIDAIDVVFDYDADYALLECAIGDSGFNDRIHGLLNPVNVGPLTESGDGRIVANKCYRELGKRNLRRHHALADALALRAAYMTSVKGAV